MSLDSIIEFVAVALGANLFKKYCPIGGSYWNSTHMNKNKVWDLRHVIGNANEYTLGHHLSIAFKLIYFAIRVHVKLPRSLDFGIAGSLVMDLYGMLIQKYNLILATKALENIKR